MKLLSTKEVASLLQVNEKMVYSLIADKGLPATKVTGKWLFPRYLVEHWLENQTENFPSLQSPLCSRNDLLVIAGSNDILLERAIAQYNRNSDTLAVFANVGSMGGFHALRRRLCHMAASHIREADGREYNFETARQELEGAPVVVNFCNRHQGLVVRKGNPKAIVGIKDLGQGNMTIVNRHLGTGTRLLLDKNLAQAEINGEKIVGYTKEVSRHLDVGLEVLAGRADAGPCIEPVADLLDLDFVPLCWERFDLVVDRNLFFEKSIQEFLSMLHGDEFKQLSGEISGYDLSLTGTMVFESGKSDYS
jgi:putative molybdopterin biosynthesis protein